METPERTGPRVLALDPTSRGFGYVIFEGPGSLVDWGLVSVRGRSRDRNRRCLDRLDTLVQRYCPQVLVLEDPDDRRCRRHLRVRRLLTRTRELAGRWGVRPRAFSTRAVRRTFAASRPQKKYDVAVILAARHPELRRHLPPNRASWMSEDPRMAIFDAAALAAAFFHRHPGGRGRRTRTS